MSTAAVEGAGLVDGDDRPRVRALLRVDSMVCLASGAIATLAAEPLGEVLDVATGWVRGTGVFLVAYAVALWLLARAPRGIAIPGAAATAAGDALWVIASVGLVVAGAFSGAGNAIVVAVAAVVAWLGASKLVALRS